MKRTLYTYTKHTENNRTYYTEKAYPLNIVEITPVYEKDGNLVITTVKGEVKVDKESIIKVTKEVLERNGIEEIPVAPKVDKASNAVLDKNNNCLYDKDGVQIRVKES